MVVPGEGGRTEIGSEGVSALCVRRRRRRRRTSKAKRRDAASKAACLLAHGRLAGWLAARCDEREEDDGGKEGKTASYMGVIVVEEGFFI